MEYFRRGLTIQNSGLSDRAENGIGRTELLPNGVADIEFGKYFGECLSKIALKGVIKLSQERFLDQCGMCGSHE